MSALIREQIVERLETADVAHRLVVSPLLDPKVQIGPGSVDLRLGSEFLTLSRENSTHFDPFAAEAGGGVSQRERRQIVPLGGPFVLHPGQFVLGATLEFLVIPRDVVGQVVSRSSWGRVGLFVATAVAVQPGFQGVLTLELVNTGAEPMILRPGLRVAQLQLWESSQPTEDGYNAKGKYRAPLGPQSNRLAWEERERRALQDIGSTLLGRPDTARAPGGAA